MLKMTLLIPLLIATGCASTAQWSSGNDNRELGIVRYAYAHGAAHDPELSGALAAQLAGNRCNAWGYSRAQEIPGYLRHCSEQRDGSCELWTVTREFQCENEGSRALRAAR